MDKSAESVVRHFLSDTDLVIEELGSGNESDYVKYLLETDRVDVPKSANQGMMVSLARNPDTKTREQRRAEQQAAEAVEDDDTYFLVMDKERNKPIVGHAKNVEKGRATEMRVEIFDDDYRGLRNGDGESLYDILTDLRLNSAQGTPYVCNLSPKAQYKMENTEFNGGGFEILKWAPAFENEEMPGVLMAYTDGEREDSSPSNLYVPETDDDFLAGFVEETLESFYGDKSTALTSQTSFDDYSDFHGLDLEVNGSARGKKCFRVSGGGNMKFDGVYEQIKEAKEDADDLVEVRVDAEEPDALRVSEQLLDERWLPTGYVPDIGGEYDAHELSFYYPKRADDYSMTERVADHFERFGIPYRKNDPEDSFDDMKSMPVEVGVMSREFSPDNPIRYSHL